MFRCIIDFFKKLFTFKRKPSKKHTTTYKTNNLLDGYNNDLLPYNYIENKTDSYSLESSPDEYPCQIYEPII